MSQKKIYAYTKESFQISGRGIILSLKHNYQGLAKGTLLQSENSNKKWEIQARLIYDHAIEVQKIFENEFREYVRMSFKTLENTKQSIQKIKAKEEQNIYEYMIRPVGHDSKPMEQEQLLIFSE